MANNLKVYRGKLGLSQKELGEKLGVTRITIINVENGNSCFTKNTISKACEMFECTPVELMGEDCLKIIPTNDDDCLKLINIIVKKIENTEIKEVFENCFNALKK